MSDRKALNSYTGFTSVIASRCAQVGILGFLGFVGFVPGWERLQAIIILTALIAFAAGIELLHRSRRQAPARDPNDLTGIGGFYSAAALRCVQIGCLGFIGFLGYAIGSDRMLAITALISLIGLGYAMEFVHRLRHGVPVFRLPNP